MLALLSFLTTGCAERGGFLNGGSSAGQLRVSLSRSQFENEQLKAELAKLKEENRSMEDRLVQEQLHNGDLTARLDDARNLLSDRGINAGTRMGSRSAESRGAEPDEEFSRPRPRTLPAGRTTRKPRKPPAASIPGDLDDLPTATDADDAPSDTISFKANDFRPRRRLFDDDDSHAIIDEDQLHWRTAGGGTIPANGTNR